MIDIINKRQEVFDLLSELKPGAQAVFGKLTPQHMVEHLAFTISYSNGNREYPLMTDEENAAKIREFTINTDKKIPPGFKSPLMGDDLPELKCNSIHEAIETLQNELEDFDRFYQQNPDRKVMQPVMGYFGYQEWVIYHNKHFTHHFEQFNLIESNKKVIGSR